MLTLAVLYDSLDSARSNSLIAVYLRAMKMVWTRKWDMFLWSHAHKVKNYVKIDRNMIAQDRDKLVMRWVVSF